MIACTQPNACATVRSSRSAWNVRNASNPSLRRFESVRAQADSLSRDYCDLPLYQAPDMEKRRTMNALLMAAVALPTGHLGYTYLSSLVPPRDGGAGGSVVAKDAFSNDVQSKDWLATHPAGDRSLVQGLRGDATYLIVRDDGGLQNYGLNSICTHLGCVVPWNAAENKFMCPCHGSQYNTEGSVVRGPAPLPLALAHAETADNGTVLLAPWSEEDFRTGQKPWWI